MLQEERTHATLQCVRHSREYSFCIVVNFLALVSVHSDRLSGHFPVSMNVWVSKQIDAAAFILT